MSLSSRIPSAGRRPGDFAPLLAAAAVSFTPLVLVPAHVYLVNRASVVVFLPELLGGTMVLAATATLLLTGFLALVAPPWRIRLATLLFGVAALLWFHGYCLVWSYDQLDGATIEWGAHAGRGAVDAVLWLVLLPLLLWQAARLYPFLGRLAAGLLALQTASLGLNLLRAENTARGFAKHYYVEQQSAFEFSTGRNVIFIVLDEFQSDIFAETVLPRENLRRHFSGFTYFPDTVAGANFTELALPAMLTGRIYSNRQPKADFLRDAYLQHSLPAGLKREGWNVHLFPWRGFANEAIHYHESVASNFRRRPQPVADRLVDSARLVDLGLFRCLPQFLKRRVHNDSNWWLGRLAKNLPLSGRGRTAADIKEHAAGHTLDHLLILMTLGHENPPDFRFSTKAGPDVFKFYHLAGLHVPVKLRRDLTYGNFEYNRANFSEQAEAYARIMGALLDELRQAGAYDNSMIIIAGDHGSGRSPELYVQPGAPDRVAELDRTAAGNNFQRDKARGLPLLLVKPFGGTGALRTSRAPAALVDLPATIWAALGRPAPPVPAVRGLEEFHGRPLFSLREDEARPRYYGAIRWSADQNDFANPITLYRVDGDGWSDASWSFVRFLDPPDPKTPAKD